jgi:L-lactate dehydrogenase
MNKKARICIVGVGDVGSTTAYTLLLRQRCQELVLIDANEKKALGDALDMNHGMPFLGGTRVWQGDYSDCAEASIIIVAAGSAQRPGETRLDLLKRNAVIFDSIIENVTRYNQDGILLIATNPVDIMAHLSYQKSGWPAHRVIGSGTLLDSARFRYLIGEKMGVDPRSVHAHIIGEHGDTELAVWSRANIAGIDVDLSEDEKQEIYTNTRDAAYQIIDAKGSTYYAIALALDRIVTAILHDEAAVLNVSTYLENYHGISGVYLGVPCVVDKSGVREVLKLQLTDQEQAALKHSAETLAEKIQSLT